ncbi:hypothetical protein B296_00013069 [Ensete ventricosum]|uniref:Uncharacterized protein n=1 Tax=Ensete ventricosum TaxID=4639 RepID=A0A426YG73_ENSVE|nr:hypothetical protein B296_00013069 [Ensete ventricosum]
MVSCLTYRLVVTFAEVAEKEVMFRQSSNRNSLDKGSMVKRVLQIAFLLAVVVWLLNRINKNEYAGDQINDDQEYVDFGRKGKAGSENVIVINGQATDFYDISETIEAGGRAEAFGQHTEEKNEDESFGKEQEESQKNISDTDQTETQEEQFGNKDGNDDSGISNRDVAVGNEMSTSEMDALRLPSQRNSENSHDPNEGENLGVNSLQQNELIISDGSKSDTEEEITSDEERIFSSQNQLEGDREVDEIEKETIDSNGGVKSETEISSENSFEVEKETTKTNGGDKFEADGSNILEDTTANPSPDDASFSLPDNENNEVSINNESSDKVTLDSQGDISTHSEATEHHNLQNVSSDTRTEDGATNLPNTTEEKVPVIPTDNEVPKREAVEFQDNSVTKAEVTNDDPSVEEINTESNDKLPVTSVADHAENVELPVFEKALERDAVDSNGDNASDSGRNDFKEEKMDLETNKEDTTSEPQNAGDSFSLGTNSQTSSASEAGNSSHNNENILQIPTNEVPKADAQNSQVDDFSKGENSRNIEDTTELNPKEETNTELGNNDASSGGGDNADSWKEGGKDSE